MTNPPEAKGGTLEAALKKVQAAYEKTDGLYEEIFGQYGRINSALTNYPPLHL